MHWFNVVICLAKLFHFTQSAFEESNIICCNSLKISCFAFNNRVRGESNVNLKEILEDISISSKEADEIIMRARSSWFEEDDKKEDKID